MNWAADWEKPWSSIGCFGYPIFKQTQFSAYTVDTIANSNYYGLIAVHCGVMINLSGGSSASYVCCGRLLIDGLTTQQPRTTQLDYIVHIKPKGPVAIFLTQCEAMGGASAPFQQLETIFSNVFRFVSALAPQIPKPFAIDSHLTLHRANWYRSNRLAQSVVRFWLTPFFWLVGSEWSNCRIKGFKWSLTNYISNRITRSRIRMLKISEDGPFPHKLLPHVHQPPGRKPIETVEIAPPGTLLT